MQKGIIATVLFYATPSQACVFCNQDVANGIYNTTFYPNLFTLLSAFIALAAIIVILSIISAKRHKSRLLSSPDLLAKGPLLITSMILGIGIGGFIDGIVLHQILQWHEMLSNKVAATSYVGKSINMFWDGIFHGFCVLVVLIGTIQMWRLLKRRDINTSGNLFFGGLVSGWAVFNLVEGIIDHHILKLHNVYEFSADHDNANYGFLAVSALMLLFGYLIYKKA